VDQVSAKFKGWQVPHSKRAEVARGGILLQVGLRDTPQKLISHKAGMVHVGRQHPSWARVAAPVLRENISERVNGRGDVGALGELEKDFCPDLILAEWGCGLSQDAPGGVQKILEIHGLGG
jgi:hypothetical protein